MLKHWFVKQRSRYDDFPNAKSTVNNRIRRSHAHRPKPPQAAEAVTSQFVFRTRRHSVINSTMIQFAHSVSLCLCSHFTDSGFHLPSTWDNTFLVVVQLTLSVWTVYRAVHCNNQPLTQWKPIHIQLVGKKWKRGKRDLVSFSLYFGELEKHSRPAQVRVKKRSRMLMWLLYQLQEVLMVNDMSMWQGSTFFVCFWGYISL